MTEVREVFYDRAGGIWQERTGGRMAYLLVYIKKGEGCYPDHNYPGHTAWNCDWEHAVHLAVSEDGCTFRPLRNNTGILFAKASFWENEFVGVTKTLVDPWVFRAADGSFFVSAVRRNRNAADTENPGCMVVYHSRDMVHYEEPVFVQLAEEEVRRPRCCYEAERESYYVEWETERGIWGGYSSGLRCLDGDKVPAAGKAPGSEGYVSLSRRKLADERVEKGVFGIEGCVPGNVIEITQEEQQILCEYFDEIRFVGIDPVRLEWPVGKVPTKRTCETKEWQNKAEKGLITGSVVFPSKVTCRYSDGSVHEKWVRWDPEQLAGVDVSKPGEWEISGTILQKRWEFPLPLRYPPHESAHSCGMSDPCVTEYHGKYYLSSTGSSKIQLRIADTVEGTFTAEPVVIYQIPLVKEEQDTATWAAELHEIGDTLYLLIAICWNGDWEQVKSYMLRCDGDPGSARSWETPQLCMKADGSPLTEGGISLDMTYFRDQGTDYVMWSDRKMCYDTGTLEPGTADIYIATVDPKEPFRLTSAPHCVVRPMYGWDRYETEVDEGPYLLRHGEDLFVTISGSSTGMGDLYNVGLLRAKSGTDLLKQENWTWIPYPLLTKESVPGEYGPGHNNFVKDPDTGDDLMIYHAIPHDEKGRALGRQPGIRRVHWAKSGLPYLEMTPERDLPEGREHVTMKLIIK